jgi:hypothetical protein
MSEVPTSDVQDQRERAALQVAYTSWIAAQSSKRARTTRALAAPNRWHWLVLDEGVLEGGLSGTPEHYSVRLYLPPRHYVTRLCDPCRGAYRTYRSELLCPHSAALLALYLGGHPMRG